MKSNRIQKYLKTRVKLKLFERKLEFWNLFENWSLENYLKIKVLKIQLKNWGFEKLNLKNEILGIYLKMESLKKIEFGNYNFWKFNLKIEVTENPEFLKVNLKKKWWNVSIKA